MVNIADYTAEPYTSQGGSLGDLNASIGGRRWRRLLLSENGIGTLAFDSNSGQFQNSVYIPQLLHHERRATSAVRRRRSLALPFGFLHRRTRGLSFNFAVHQLCCRSDEFGSVDL